MYLEITYLEQHLFLDHFYCGHIFSSKDLNKNTSNKYHLAPIETK